MQYVVGALIIAIGLGMLGWGGHLLRHPPNDDDRKWAKRHPFLASMLNGVDYPNRPRVFGTQEIAVTIAIGIGALIVGIVVLAR